MSNARIDLACLYKPLLSYHSESLNMNEKLDCLPK